MASTRSKPKKHTEYHKDGSVWARGQTLNGVPVGYWEWFRKQGTIMRSGTFDEAGNQIGEWITYDRSGEVHKVTDMNRKARRTS
jgi:antitoxin component YwqK of YwqJK toxin-antitoxin module